jgi:putative hemolysin
VPETKLIGDLFREMQVAGIQMAIAVDEFGGTAGIVTLEQLLEEMVGQVHDELAPRDVEITLIDENTTEVDGSLSVEEARDELGIDVPEGPYDTIAGYVLSVLGHIPNVGETVDIDPHRITVAEMGNQKIELLRVTRMVSPGRPA